MKVSVVIPTHNRVELLEQALNSVMCQSYKDLEIIVISDGSTDKTDIKVNEYKKIDSRIKYISYYPNKGGNHARNVGIKNATGEFIAFLDDDDEWESHKIELQVREFSKNSKVGLVYTGIEIIYKDNGVSYKSLPTKTGDLSKEILIHNCIGTTSTVMIKKEFLKKSGGFDENLKALQDYDLWIRICQLANVGAVKKPLLKYNNFDSIDQISDDLEKYKIAIDYIDSKYKSLYESANKEIKFKHQQSSYMLLANKGLRNRNKKEARTYIKKHFKVKSNLKAIIMYFLSYFNYNTILKLRSKKK